MDMTVARPRAALRPALTDDRQWYKDAIIYQLHLKSFFDSNNDGVGDFRSEERRVGKECSS